MSNPNFRRLARAARARASRRSRPIRAAPTTVLGGREPVFADVYTVTDGLLPRVRRRARARPHVHRGRNARRRRAGGRRQPRILAARRSAVERDLSSLRLQIEGVRARVVGVMPEGFDYPAGAEIWAPKELRPDTTGRTGHNNRVDRHGLKDRGTLPQAVGGAERDRRAAEAGVRPAATTPVGHDGDLHETLTGGSRSTLWLLLGAVGLVLLIACANVASTMFATRRRATRRARDPRGARRRPRARRPATARGEPGDRHLGRRAGAAARRLARPDISRR